MITLRFRVSAIFLQRIDPSLAAGNEDRGEAMRAKATPSHFDQTTTQAIRLNELICSATWMHNLHQ